MGSARPSRIVLAAATAAVVATAGTAPAQAAPAPRSMLWTQAAEGVVVNRLAVKATPVARRRLRVEVLVIARAVDDQARTLTAAIGRCGSTPRRLPRCMAVRRRPFVATAGAQPWRWSATVPVPRRGAALGFQLAAPGRRVGAGRYEQATTYLLLPSTAWRRSQAGGGWFGLKTPSSAWGTTTLREIRVVGARRHDGRVRVGGRLDVALPGTSPVDALLGTLRPLLGIFDAGRPSAAAPAGRTSLTPVTVEARDAYGLQLTRDGEPVAMVWLPEPA